MKKERSGGPFAPGLPRPLGAPGVETAASAPPPQRETSLSLALSRSQTGTRLSKRKEKQDMHEFKTTRNSTTVRQHDKIAARGLQDYFLKANV